MKVRYLLAIILAIALTIVAGGGLAVAGVQGNTTTGGGWFEDIYSGNRINFGLNAQDKDEGTAKGEFQLVDHGSKTNLHGTLNRLSTTGSTSLLWGKCSIDGEGEYSLSIVCRDNGEPGTDDSIGIRVFDGMSPIIQYSGILGAGNLQVR